MLKVLNQSNWNAEMSQFLWEYKYYYFIQYKIPCPKLMIMVSFCWKMNVLPNKKQFSFIDDVLDTHTHTRASILTEDLIFSVCVGVCSHKCRYMCLHKKRGHTPCHQLNRWHTYVPNWWLYHQKYFFLVFPLMSQDWVRYVTPWILARFTRKITSVERLYPKSAVLTTDDVLGYRNVTT